MVYLFGFRFWFLHPHEDGTTSMRQDNKRPHRASKHILDASAFDEPIRPRQHKPTIWVIDGEPSRLTQPYMASSAEFRAIEHVRPTWYQYTRHICTPTTTRKSVIPSVRSQSALSPCPRWEYPVPRRLGRATRLGTTKYDVEMSTRAEINNSQCLSASLIREQHRDCYARDTS